VVELDGALVKRGAFGEMLMDLGLRLQPEVEGESGDESGGGDDPPPPGPWGTVEVEGWPFGGSQEPRQGGCEDRAGWGGL